MNLFNKLEKLVLTLDQENVTLAQQLAKGQNFDLEQALRDKYRELISFWSNYDEASETIYEDFMFNMKEVEVDVRSKDIKKLPKHINLMHMKYLWCNKNKNLILSEDFYKMKSLEQVNFEKCGLTEISKEIQQLKTLKRINLNSNKLKRIPKEIAKLDKLEHLYLSYNPLEDIPDEILEMQNLRLLTITNTKIPEERLKYIKDNMPQTHVICEVFKPKNINYNL